MPPKRRKASKQRSTRRAAGRSRTRPTRPATPRQVEILTFVRDYSHKNGYSPTYDEIADQFGISKVTVFEHLTTLEERGLLKRDKHKARSLQLARHLQLPDERPGCLRLAGRIAAGAPIEAIENPEVIDLDEIFSSERGAFLLEVKGDSMIDDQIADGDYVVVERRTTPYNGETVVALLDNDEATLKRYYRERNRIRLQPANPSYKPIYTTNAQIQGVVIGVIRRMR
jgi:repressor LexA